MKALVLTEIRKLEIQDVPKPELGTEDVLVRVKACGICGSDIHGYDGKSGRRIPPIIMGHEASGIIDAIGANVKGWQVGDRVTFDSTIYCGNCKFCRKGLINLCENRRVLGVSCEEYRQQGAFAEFVSVPQRILFRLPDQVSYDEAAMVEPVSIAFHAVGLNKIRLDSSVLVVGAGVIGLLVIQTLRLAGCGMIIAVDINDEKLTAAKEFGADYTLNNTNLEEFTHKLKELIGEDGVDIAFDVVGLNHTTQLALNWIRKGGVITLIGNISKLIEVPLQKIVTRQLKIQGSCASNGEYQECLNMINRQRIDVRNMISMTAPLEDGQKLFDILYEQKNSSLLKVILRP